MGIFEFSRDPECIARLAFSKAKGSFALPDGTLVSRGEVLAELHLWNERMPQLPASGPTVGWALGMRRKIIRSLQELSALAAVDPRFKNIRVFHGGTSFTGRSDLGDALTATGLAERLGFSVALHGRSYSSLHDLIENLYYMALVWAFNPNSLRAKGLRRLSRVDLYMTRDTLINRYSRG